MRQQSEQNYSDGGYWHLNLGDHQRAGHFEPVKPEKPPEGHGEVAGDMQQGAVLAEVAVELRVAVDMVHHMADMAAVGRLERMPSECALARELVTVRKGGESQEEGNGKIHMVFKRSRTRESETHLHP